MSLPPGLRAEVVNLLRVELLLGRRSILDWSRPSDTSAPERRGQFCSGRCHANDGFLDRSKINVRDYLSAIAVTVFGVAQIISGLRYFV